MDGFIFGGNTSVLSPQDLARRRALADSIRSRNADTVPKNIWEGLSSAASDITGAIESNRLDKKEAEGRASGEAAYEPVIEAIKNKQPIGEDALLGVLGNQWANEGQRQVAQTLLKQQLETDAPLTKWQQTQAEIDRERTAKIGATSKFGLNPVWTTDADGNPMLYQLPQAGGAPQPVQFPQGTVPRAPLSMVNTGTAVVPVNTRTGASETPLPIDVAGKANAEAIGKGQGESSVALPQIENSAKLMTDTIDSLATDPYLPSMLGPVQGRMPNVTGEASRVQGKIDQLQGQTFLSAYDMLRGGGAITEIEGAKAEKAKARLATAQNEKDFRDALTDLRSVVVNGLNAARVKAGQGGGAPQIGQTRLKFNPATGELE